MSLVRAAALFYNRRWTQYAAIAGYWHLTKIQFDSIMNMLEISGLI
jgi:hypothetical protein